VLAANSLSPNQLSGIIGETVNIPSRRR